MDNHYLIDSSWLDGPLALFMKVQFKRICICVSLGRFWAVFVTGTNLQKTELRRLLIYPRNHISMNLPL